MPKTPPQKRGPGPKKPSGVELPPAQRFAPLAIGLGIGMMLLITVTALRRRPPPAPAASAEPGTETPAQRSERLARACEAARTMLWTGSSWGAMPLEGFTVRLWLGPKDGKMVTHPVIEAAGQKSKLGEDVDAVLAKVNDGSVSVVRHEPEGELEIAFSEGYARAFFELEGRNRFIGLGERIARETNADGAALYAGCAHLDTRDVGAWFHGKDTKKAAAALVYVMGLPGGVRTPKHVPAAKDLATIQAATAPLDESTILEIVRDDGARTVTTDGVSITFPFSNPVRAAQSSAKIAEKLSLAKP
ncbi:hypothetical protein [Polyangium jinanense]|uniref:Uncharacterized protein n=1 Tax=Polyangium jinanense TaxID=2829994 RepID=A0A9X3XBK2_9BACT|nr:hypothetical protein [Polyangium jinanense]MDC3959334.1 hypothetical protein [Polyangium jinanense]MDC3985743.1 hypothetical protein [Polyangium jinanense]